MVMSVCVYVLADLCVSHTGCCYKCLLKGFLLQAEFMLLLLSAPPLLQQVLDDIQMAPQSCVDQSTLSILIHMIHLMMVSNSTSVKTNFAQVCLNRSINKFIYRQAKFEQLFIRNHLDTQIY